MGEFYFWCKKFEHRASGPSSVKQAITPSSLWNCPHRGGSISLPPRMSPSFARPPRGASRFVSSTKEWFGFFGLSVILPLGVIVAIYRGAPPSQGKLGETNKRITHPRPAWVSSGPQPTRWSGLYWVVLGDLPVGVTNNAYTGLPQ